MPCIVTSDELTYKVMFTPSCRYDVGEDQSDVNKLFGIGYAPHHHYNSARFGWRYEKSSDMIEIMAYWYLDGKRHMQSIVFVAIGHTLHYAIRRCADHHLLMVRNNTYSVPVARQMAGILLQAYFGGNKTAPHDIHINMTRL